MIILGIETSCDETGAAIIKDGTKILSNVVASSQELHIKTGGIIPEKAAREQVKSIIPVIDEALQQARVSPQDLDALAVTYGPGLIGSLLVGVETAKTLSFVWQKPLVPVNHLLAHVYANWLSAQLPKFPIVVLIVSGGHTELILMQDHGQYEWLGGTRDDAAGEAFDKIARLLNLGYPGGPAIAAAAEKFAIGHRPYAIRLPRPMIGSGDFDFSFSGLKTAVLREVKKLKKDETEPIAFLAFETQEAITDVLVQKTLEAARQKDVKNICLAGGVAANQHLREKFLWKLGALKMDIKLFVPPPSFCTDNAAAIASCAFFNYSPMRRDKINVQPGLGLKSEL